MYLFAMVDFFLIFFCKSGVSAIEFVVTYIFQSKMISHTTWHRAKAKRY